MKSPSLLLLAVLLGAGCRTPTTTTTPANAPPAAGDENIGYPGTLRPPAQMGPDIQWQQRVTAHWEGKPRSFDAVLSKTEGEIMLIGLGPMKSPGFIVRFDGEDVEFENRTKQEVPIDPGYIMLDVQRVFFPWIPGEAGEGTRTHRVDGELVEETWAAGKLVERRFRREDGRPEGEIVVRYEGWEPGADAPAKAVLENGWFGYRLEIETLVQQRI